MAWNVPKAEPEKEVCVQRVDLRPDPRVKTGGGREAGTSGKKEKPMHRFAIELAPSIGSLYLITQDPLRRFMKCISKLSAQAAEEGVFLLHLPTPLAKGGAICIHFWLKWFAFI